MKTNRDISTEGLTSIPLEGVIDSGYITYLLRQITDSDVENSSMTLTSNNFQTQTLNQLLQNIIEGKNDKQTVDGVYVIEVDGHFIMLNLQCQNDIVKYKIFDSLSHTPNGPRRLELVTQILENRFGVDRIVPSENYYVEIQQGIDINAHDTDNCGLLCFFAQLLDESHIRLQDLLPNSIEYHNINKILNSLRGKNIATLELEPISHTLLQSFIQQPSLPPIIDSNDEGLRNKIINIFQRYEDSENIGTARIRPFAEAREKDLAKLKQILEYLTKITTKEEITKELLNQIGEETAKITVNNGSKNNFIRNKYGLIGSKSDFTTKDGIEFIELQALRYIEEFDLELSMMDDLFHGLKITQQKINFAIQEEQGECKYSLAIRGLKNFSSTATELPKLSKFTKVFYSKYLLNKIDNELKIFGNISNLQTLLTKEDKYFVSRIFAKIGELAKEFIDHNKDLDEILERRILVFKFLKDVRDYVNHNPMTLILKEIKGLGEVIKIIENGLRDGIDEAIQEKLDEFLQNFQYTKTKTGTKETAKKDPFVSSIEFFIDKSEKYFKLELEANVLEDLLNKKDSIEKQWEKRIVPLEVKRNELYNTEIKALETAIKILIEKNQYLEGIEERFNNAQTKQQKLHKEIEGLKSKYQRHVDNLICAEQVELSDRDAARLRGAYKVSTIGEVIDKIKASLTDEQTLIDVKEILLKENEEAVINMKEDSNFRMLKELKQQIKEEKKKIQPSLNEVNAERAEVDKEMGEKIKTINEQIFQVKQKFNELENVKKQILGFILEIGHVTQKLETILNEDLLQEIKETLSKYISSQQTEIPFEQVETKSRICKRLEKITDELNYLQQIYINDLLDPEIRSYILQHSLSIIGQYSRDVEELENTSNFDFMQTITQNAITFSESWRSTIRTRNKGIAHDTSSFNEENFFRTVRADTLSMHEDIKAVREILIFDYDQSKSANTENIFDYTFGALMNNLAINYLRLGNYEKAEKCFKEALEYFDRSRIARTFGSNDPTMLLVNANGIEKIGGSNPNLFVIIHEDSNFDARKAMVLGNFAEVYIRTQKYEDALLLLEQVEELEIKTNGVASAITLSNQVFLLNNLGRKVEAQEKRKLISQSSDDKLDAITLNDIIVLEKEGHIEEAKRKLDDIIAITLELEIKFSALSQRALLEAKSNDFDQAKSTITEMEDFLIANEGAIKEKFGNEFLGLKRQLIEAKMGRLVLKCKTHANEGDAKLIHSLNQDDISEFRKVSGDICRFNANKTGLRISEDAVHNFCCALSNASIALQEHNPQTSVDFLNKALFFQKQYGFDQSTTLLNLGNCYYALYFLENKEDHKKKALEYLELAKLSTIDLSTSACIYDTIGGIHMRNGDYRTAIAHYQDARHKWPEDPKRDKIDADINFCSSMLKIYTAIENSLLNSYEQFSRSHARIDGQQFWALSVDKDILQSYLKYELKTETILTEINGRPAINFNKFIALALEEKLSIQRQSIKTCFVTSVIYDNPFLNTDIIDLIGQTKGIDGINKLLNLDQQQCKQLQDDISAYGIVKAVDMFFYKENSANVNKNAELFEYAEQVLAKKEFHVFLELLNDNTIAEQILLAVKEFGVEHVLGTFFEKKIVDKHIAISSVPTLGTVEKIEAIIGKESLYQVEGFYKYVSNSLSRNAFSLYATKVIQVIGNLVNNLEEVLDFGSLYESIDIDNQVAITITQLENLFDFIASETHFIGSPPRPPYFEPDNGDSSGGGGSGGNNNLPSHDSAADPIIFLLGQSSNATFHF